MAKNKLIIAAAGSGKTTHLVAEALSIVDEPVLVTTYTEANEAEIRRAFLARRGCIPGNVTIQTWFSFLLQHGVRPFQGDLLDPRIRGMVLVNSMSAPRVGESNAVRYYLNEERKIYSDKLSKCVVRANAASRGCVVDRISRVFSHVFIDEVQDLAGYDLEILKLFFSSRMQVLMVGDPRQVTYLTHHERKFQKYAYGRIQEFSLKECRGLDVSVDAESLQWSYRCNSAICEFADRLYPEFGRTQSRQKTITGHDGVFVVARANTARYIDTFRPTQLRLNRKTKCLSPEVPALNFGEAKGLTRDRVIVYPTAGMIEWLSNNGTRLADKTRAHLYVGLTRAKYSVAISCDIDGDLPSGIGSWP